MSHPTNTKVKRKGEREGTNHNGTTRVPKHREEGVHLGGSGEGSNPGKPLFPIFHREQRQFKREDSAIRPERFREVVDSMGVEERIISSFAAPSNTLCERIWTLQGDALSESWTGQFLLWMNPLFSQLD